MSLTDEQLARLPEYVRTEISRLRRDLAEWSKIRGAIEDGSSRVSMRRADRETFLPETHTYRFDLGRDGRFDVGITRVPDGFALEVFGVRPMIIGPVSANVIRLRAGG